MDRPDFIALQTIQEVRRLTKKSPEAFLMAGGTDLLVLRRNHLVKPRSILYLKTIPGLSEILPEEGGGLRLGALATLDAVARDPSLKQNEKRQFFADTWVRRCQCPKAMECGQLHRSSPKSMMII